MPEDTGKVNTLIRLGEQYNFFIPDSGTYYYMQARRLSKQLNYYEGTVRFIHDYTEILNTRLKHDESLKLNLEALALCEQHMLKEELRTQSLLHTGIVYLYKENYQTAAEYCLKALPLIERSGDPVALSEVYRHLSVLYRYLNQPQKALKYGHAALTCAEKSREPLSISMDCNNLGTVLSELKRTDEANYYLNKAYVLGKKMNDRWAQITALIERGKILYNTGASPGRYIVVYREALSLAELSNDRIGQSEALYGIAVGRYRQKQYEKAEKYAKASLAISRSINHKQSEKEVLLLLSDIQIASGNLTAATPYRSAYDSIATSLTDIVLQKNVQELEAKYQLEKKQSEILKQNLLLTLKNREAFRQRTWLAASVTGLLCLFLLLLGLHRYYRQRHLLSSKAMAALQAEQENLRLNALLEGQLKERQRISQEMHDDMGSGLTSILFLSRTIQGQEVVAAKLKHTAKDLVQKMNEIIWTMNPEQNTLDSMVAYVRQHLAETLENAELQYVFNITDPLPSIVLSQEFRRNIYLVCKEAVHNIVRHANATMVAVSIEVTNELQITIRDNGVGLSNNAHSPFSNGMKNMQCRMAQIQGTFSAISEAGTRITLRAPLPV